MLNNGLDETPLLEILDALPGERAVDLHAVDKSGDGDETVRLNILGELLGGGLVENDGVLGLVLDLALGPNHIVFRQQIDFSSVKWSSSISSSDGRGGEPAEGSGGNREEGG